MEDDNTVVAGTQFVLDLDAVTMSHFLQMTPMTIKMMVVTSQVLCSYKKLRIFKVILLLAPQGKIMRVNFYGARVHRH